jgi:hypothetical protein
MALGLIWLGACSPRPSDPIIPTATLPAPTYTASSLPTDTPLPPTATETPTPTIAPTNTLAPTETIGPPIFTLTRDSNCRAGPGTEYDIVTQVAVGRKLEIVGQSQVLAGLWWNVRVGELGCWIYSELGESTGNLAGVPLLVAPLTPTPQTPTKTPTPKNVVRFPLTIENSTSENVCYLFFVLSDESGWGSNLMPDFAYIPPGGKITFQLTGGTYNLRAEDCNDDVIKISNDQKITAAYTWVVD